MAQALETARDPPTLGGGLDEDPGRRPVAQELRETLRVVCGRGLDQFLVLGEDANLAVHPVDIDANLLHG
jgi:hypothetical protein